ncbi:hypothetical protein J3R82DRAFT_11594 [Butyriboletus roseoflavus]|nr:hypothetical protein J3R82DRAFT_11594 [Butyriboletus roseoflavus]
MDMDNPQPLPHNHVHHGAPVVHGTHTQIYNAISRHVCNQAHFHYVQLGLATSIFIGTLANTVASKRRFEQHKQHCSNGLPHQHFTSAIRGDD